MNSKDWRPTAFVDTAPGGVPEPELDASRLERRRALLGFIRHLTTLATAALVLTVTLADRAFAQPLRREAVTVAVGAFLFSLVAGALSSLILVGRGPRAAPTPWPPDDRRAGLASALVTVLGFLAGAGALAWFFYANWRR